ncbi:UNVERIFIED_CONTAM: hypothetical protein Sradi_1860800 [Sesamum radiatum]|uniref:Uncharacterized protein n=1 Tax=Sesamum radiatum TaxID=300843 RepID=A0AAW2TXN8_SESRA
MVASMIGSSPIVHPESTCHHPCCLGGCALSSSPSKNTPPFDSLDCLHFLIAFEPPLATTLTSCSSPFLQLLADRKVMNLRIANNVRAKKGTIPENLLLELENAEVGGSSTPSDRTSSIAIVPMLVVAALEGPSGGHTPVCVNSLQDPHSPKDGGSNTAPGEPSKSYKRKRKSKSNSQSKSQSNSKSRSSRSIKSSRQKSLEARLVVDCQKEEDNVKTLRQQEAQWQIDRTNLQSPTCLVAEMVGDKLIPD